MCKFLKTGHQDFWAVSIIQTYQLIESKCLRMISLDVWEAMKHTRKGGKEFLERGEGGPCPNLKKGWDRDEIFFHRDQSAN